MNAFIKYQRWSITNIIIACILLFVALYLLAAWLYPGGSQAHPQQAGFSRRYNYWCNLFNETAINGRYNTGRAAAIAGMCVLSVTLALFWLHFPVYAGTQKGLRRLIQVCGVAAAISGIGVFMGPHDAMINIAGFFGAGAMAGVMMVLWRLRWKRLWALALCCLLLTVLNNLLYYTGSLYWLPLVQKITFACFLAWITAVTIRLKPSKTITAV
jgi:hypothetical protein